MAPQSGLRVLVPEPEVFRATPGQLAPRLDSLEGKSVAILRYVHISKSVDEDYLAGYMRGHSTAARVVEARKERTAPWPEARLKELAGTCDAVIASSAQ